MPILLFFASIALAIILSHPSSAPAEVTVAVERQSAPRANVDFRFADISSPVQGDVGERGQWTVVSGTPDPAGGGLQTLSDGQSTSVKSARARGTPVSDLLRVTRYGP